MSLPFEGSLAQRRRSPWEALDAGLLLWRENLVYFFPFFAVPFWICAFGLCLLPESMRVWSWLTLWLLKPFFDRLLLHVISARFFEPGTGMGRLCRGLVKSLRRGLMGDLLWRRFSPLRAAMMPVRVLENVPRRRIGDRRRTLVKGGLGFCFLLTIWGIALELALLGGETLFFVIMAELLQADIISSLGELMHIGVIFLYAAWCANYMLVESLYVCMGFGLYLNSRVEVEGWDIEIMFRGFTEKDKRKSAVALAAVCCVMLGLALPVKGFAADDGGPGNGGLPGNGVMSDNDIPLEALQTILDSPDFGGERDGWSIRWKNPRQPKEAPGMDFASWLEPIRRFFSFALRLVLVGLIAALAVFLLLYLRRLGRERITLNNSRKMKSLPKTPEESPDLLLEKARAFFDRGDLRPAWGFCAAAGIRSWQAYRGLSFPPDATEYGCVDLVRASGAGRENENRAFAALVNHWVSFAYGGLLPPEGSFEEALAFCESLRAANE